MENHTPFQPLLAPSRAGQGFCETQPVAIVRVPWAAQGSSCENGSQRGGEQNLPVQPILCTPSFSSSLHRIIESFELEGTLKGHPVQLPCNEQGYPQLNQGAQSPSSLTLAVSRGRVTSPSLLATLLWMQPRVRLAFWAAKARCWLMPSCHPPAPPSPWPRLPNTHRSIRRGVTRQCLERRRWVLLDHPLSWANSTKNLITIQLRQRF